jgi:catechol 2,3-dioxygenase-like lactoylglutathione lyase family enzyme
MNEGAQGIDRESGGATCLDGSLAHLILNSFSVTKGRLNMDWKLEVVVVPVSDVDRAKRFYSEQIGFVVDVDTQISEAFRVVQMTPPGSACSITIGTGLVAMTPGSLQGLQLVVDDIEAARAELVERGVEVSKIVHYENGVQSEGKGGEWNSFIYFSDPDGNSWAVQERPASS